MSDPAFITDEEWDRIHTYIAEGPAHVQLDTNEDGTMVVFNGGAMHPRAYLEIMEDYPPEDGVVDILKNAHSADPSAPIPILPGSLSGLPVLRWKPNKVEPE